ncbi:MAG: carboxypeptidase regulatory-like domain-containing protein [Blastocatellia bacterium]|nr:carboxypeptidase regulatory-like domain-containing protein [Blastocatellia bacterium]
MKTVAILLFLFFYSFATIAQVSQATGAIQGTVLDPNKAVIVGAVVTLMNPTFAMQRKTTTLGDGTFVFPLIQPAEGYQVMVEANGFQRRVVENLTVNVTETAVANVQLAIGTTNEAITVTSDSQPVQTTNPTLGNTLTARVISSLPLNTRNPLQLLATDAGVVSVQGTTILFVAGNRSTMNNYVLNGVDANNFEWNSLGSVPTPNPDAVQEFRTQTSLYDATTGRGSGANITLMTRAGTSKLHGNLLWYHRDSALAANSFFSNRANQPKPFLLRNHFGASLGGAFPGQRSFWFVNYEGSRQRNIASLSGFMPVLPEKRDAATLATAFGLPLAAIDPVAVNLLNLPGPFNGLLMPSGTGTAVGKQGRFVFATSSVFDSDQGTTRLDHEFKLGDDINHLTGTAFFSNNRSRNPIGGNAGFSSGSVFDSSYNSYAISDTHTFNSQLLNELTLGTTINITDGNNGVNAPTVQQIGMTRFNQSVFDKIPSFSFVDQLGGLGPNLNAGPRQHTPSVTIRDMVTYLKGRHSLRIGGELRFYQFNYAQFYGQQGSLSFSNTFASQRYGKPPAGIDDLSIRDFLVGAPISMFIASGTPDRAFRAVDRAAFFQDDYRFARRLTVNLGLRYDFLGNVSEKRNKLGNFDPSLVPAEARLTGGTGLLKGFIAPEDLPSFGTPGVKNTTLFGEDKNNFAPRVGFAWGILGNGKLAIRSGYGLYFIRVSAIPTLQLTSQPPYYQQFSQTGSFGYGILKNPFPTLALPSDFPILPTPPRLTGFAASGAPIFDRLTLSVIAFDRNLRTPYSQQWNLTTQYEFLPNWTLELGYLGSHTIKLYNAQVINNALLRNANNPGALGLTTNASVNRDARVPIVGFSTSGIGMITGAGSSTYNALLLTVNRRFSRGLFLKAAYTFSKSMDNNSAGIDFDIGTVNHNQFLPQLNKGLSEHDIKHRLILTYVYDLPTPRQNLLKYVLGDWSLSGMTIWQSGFPGSVFQSIGTSSLSGSGGRASLIPGCDLYTKGSTKERLDGYLNFACVQTSPLLTAGTSFGPLSPVEGPGDQTYTISPGGSGRLMGTSGRSVFRGPNQFRWDLAVAKRIPLRWIGEAGKLEFRADFFQLLNNTIFSTPIGTATATNFGRITGSFSPNRQIQFALRVNF